jgi:hypothetical protein
MIAASNCSTTDCQHFWLAYTVNHYVSRLAQVKNACRQRDVSDVRTTWILLSFRAILLSMYKYTHVAEQSLSERTGVNLSVYFYGKRDSKPSQFLPCVVLMVDHRLHARGIWFTSAQVFFIH